MGQVFYGRKPVSYKLFHIILLLCLVHNKLTDKAHQSSKNHGTKNWRHGILNEDEWDLTVFAKYHKEKEEPQTGYDYAH